MFNNVIEYQRAYFNYLYDVTEFNGGFLTTSQDLEYINANSIIGVEAAENIVASICILLANNIYTTKVQLPSTLIPFEDDIETLYLLRYKHRQQIGLPDIELVLVDSSNFAKFKILTEQLQIQEYGKEYKANATNQILNQTNYHQYMIKFKGEFIGEFIYIPELFSIESLIIDKRYQRKGIGTKVLELMAQNYDLYLSTDNSSIEFYQKINAQIIDQTTVANLYGSPQNLLMYLSLI